MCLANDTHDDGTLLDCFLCVLDLKYAALRREGDRVVVVVVAEHGESGTCGGLTTALSTLCEIEIQISASGMFRGRS